MNMQTIKMPPLNLISAPDWYILLFSYPLLAATEKNESVQVAAKVYYRKDQLVTKV